MHIAVCSWSLLPTGPRDLCQKVEGLALDSVQLALDPIRLGDWDLAQTEAALSEAGIRVCSGMIAMEGEDYSTLETIAETGGVRSDSLWERNLAATSANAALAQQLGLSLVTFHAGFLPHDTADAVRQTMVSRLRQVADIFSEYEIEVALETGQESAATLVTVLNELQRPGVGVNFDPANMILYGMGDPIAALQQLAPWVRQLHVKDATAATTPGAWGTEVPVGSGHVDWHRFVAVVGELCRDRALVLEREAGDDRLADVARGRDLLLAIGKEQAAARGGNE
ncbi:MAG: sugar phosphate isomerase/epimerase family protein [Planctomycetota bacterium]